MYSFKNHMDQITCPYNGYQVIKVLVRSLTSVKDKSAELVKSHKFIALHQVLVIYSTEE